jgi:nitrite reductase/ring-hydroxylating ferredoxin subunit
MNESERPMTRRDCMAWLARASAALVCAEAVAPVAAAEALNLLNLRNDSARLLTSPDAIVTRTKAGLACFSTICTHRHNKLEVGKDGVITCPVHDSIFDLSGKPISGPATQPLPQFGIAVNDDGDITIDVSKSAPQGTRTPLPDWARGGK